jgi:hypothetical protein
MDVADWLSAAKADAVRRGLEELVPLLEGLAASTTALRNADESERRGPAPEPDAPQGR